MSRRPAARALLHGDAAEEVEESAADEVSGKPRLLVDNCNPDLTVAALRDILADDSRLYDRGVPVRLAFDQIQRGTVAQFMSPYALVLETHRVCRPYLLKPKEGVISEVDARLPHSFAVMYLDWRGEWHLPPLNGIASAPLLRMTAPSPASQAMIGLRACGVRMCPISLGWFLSSRRGTTHRRRFGSSARPSRPSASQMPTHWIIRAASQSSTLARLQGETNRRSSSRC